MLASGGLGPNAEGRGLPPGVFSMSEFVRLDIEGQEVAFRWGRSYELGTAAYWIEQTRLRRPLSNHRLGGSLAEEVVACILGGFGQPASLGMAAFREVQREGLISTENLPTESAVQTVLETPMAVSGYGKAVHYRFPRQRARRVVSALRFLRQNEAPTAPVALRDWLLDVPGVGPKTASWIARNWAGAAVAIIDVHVQRAGVAAGFFRSDWRLPRDYSAFEAAFRAVAKRGRVSCAALDARIWQDLSFLGRDASLLLGEPPPGSALV